MRLPYQRCRVEHLGTFLFDEGTMKKLLSSVLLVVGVFVASLAGAQNFQGTLLPSLSRTATTVNTTDQSNYQFRGVSVVINVSAFVSGTYTPTIQGKDPVSGTYYTILTGVAISGTGITVLKVYPGITATTNISVSDILPKTWRVTLAGATSPSMTFSVGVMLSQ
jgi:hypothetical protein